MIAAFLALEILQKNLGTNESSNFNPGSQIQKQPSNVFCKKYVFKNFENFTGKHLCLSLNKVAVLQT